MLAIRGLSVEQMGQGEMKKRTKIGLTGKERHRVKDSYREQTHRLFDALAKLYFRLP